MREQVDAAAREERVRGQGGVELLVRHWPARGTARAVVAIVHGFNSHGGHYLWAAPRLAAEGLAVYAVDLRGRGKSGGARFRVGQVEEYEGDVATLLGLVRTREGRRPVFLLGHSAGGVVASLYALDHGTELAGLICESFAFRVPAPALALAVVKGLGAVAPGLKVLKLPNRHFSRDPAVVAAMDADPLIAGEVQPAGTVAAMLRGTARLERGFPRITLPVFILHGSGDKVTVPAGSRQFHAEAGSADKTLKMYEGHAHDLLNDLGREQVLGDIAAWIRARLPAAPA
ncbi:MAG: alpha/beta hydrolase [Gemmatimonadetes bacterium]|nr:alpha/beta hydrolase [Gemmatimonadota bacterium]